MSAEDLAAATSYRFADWPNADVPNWRAGVYGIWRGDQFLYVGMSGRGMSAEAHLDPAASLSTKAKGLRERLASHASGRRSGDQFCVYVCDRLVLPTLTATDVDDVAAGRVLLDEVTRRFIHDELTYGFVIAQDGHAALALEERIKREGLGGQQPMLNPAARQTPR